MHTIFGGLQEQSRLKIDCERAEEVHRGGQPQSGEDRRSGGGVGGDRVKSNLNNEIDFYKSGRVQEGREAGMLCFPVNHVNVGVSKWGRPFVNEDWHSNSQAIYKGVEEAELGEFVSRLWR